MLSQKSVQQYESALQTFVTQPVVSQPGLSAVESAQSECEHVPCGGTPVACVVHVPFMHIWPVVHIFPHVPQLFASLVRS